MTDLRERIERISLPGRSRGFISAAFIALAQTRAQCFGVGPLPAQHDPSLGGVASIQAAECGYLN
jgi:hypothetical protein